MSRTKFQLIVPKGICPVKGCNMMAKHAGYCKHHYDVNRKYGDPNHQLEPRSMNSKLRGEPEYDVLGGIIQRCTNPNNRAYPDYGGRGITVCAEWTGSDGVARFIADVGPRPSDDHTIERKDVNGNYEPSNCVWATWNEQAVNRRNSQPVPGVHKHNKGWGATLRVNKVDVLKKYFANYDDAVQARKEAEQKYLPKPEIS